MTHPPAAGDDEARRRANARETETLLSRALTRAWWSLLWERAWPPLAALATACGIFLILSWTGLWLAVPAYARVAGVVLVGALVVASLVPLVRLRLPSYRDCLQRLDLESHLPHRPATAILDDLAIGQADAGSQALWKAHVLRAIAEAKRLRAGTPHPRVPLRDRYAVRALVLLLVVASFVSAGGDRTRRILAAFDWSGVVASANYRIDAWVTPPNYTGKPPVILPGIRAGEPMRDAHALTVPAGSVLTVRASGITLDLAAKGLTEGAAGNGAPPPVGTEERRFTINDSGTVTLRGAARDVTWAFNAVPDHAPTISLIKDPEPQARGALKLSYRIEDDYGATQAEAKFTLKNPPAPEKGNDPHPLYGAPDFSLVMPQARTRHGDAQTTKDLSSHPWAGAEVVMTLFARDEASNEGKSEPKTFTLPQRPFYKPLAKALVEQRRILALNAAARPRVLTALDALAIAPERFTPEASVYLGLRSLFWNLTNATKDDDLRAVAERMWAMAVQIEDGNVSDAEQALRNAQDALRQALERGASEEEIKRLMDNLRAALDKFLQALAEELKKNPQQLARPLDRNTRELRPQDLKNMLDRLENLARSGAKDAARQLLEQLQSMLENLQMARPGQQGDQDDMSALDELGDMIRKEQQLRDRTFRQGQDGRRERQRNQRGQQGQQRQQGDQQNFGDLQKNQQALREQLKKLLDEMRKRGQMGQRGQQGQQGQQAQQGQQGQEQGDDGSDSLGRAEQAMRDAEGALGEGDADSAVDAQGRAIDSLRKGAQSLAQQMQPGENGPGPNGRPGRGQARANQDTDPLGRPLRGRDYGDDTTVKVPGEIDVQRARRILEELRRRFADPERPQIELDYIERLLKDF